jgi:hypothetical protein
MARKPRQVGRYGGFYVDVEGLEELARGAGLGARQIADVWREIMRGPFGDEFLQELKARTSDARRTGYTLSRMKVNDHGADGVEIGIPSDDTARHPASSRANAKSVGVWLESGTRMHYIPTTISPYNKVAFNGVVVSRVAHPGTRATKPMFRTLQLYKRDWADRFIRELDRRLGAKMGTT